MIIVSKTHIAAPRRPLRALIAAGLAAVMLHAAPATAATGLQASPAQSSDGVTQLSWDLQGQLVEIQRASDPGFADAVLIYRGTDSASLRSGLTDGAYYYRLRALTAPDEPGPWSQPVHLQVKHHSPERAWGVFATGAVVFLATLGLIVTGGRRESRDA